MIKTPEFDRWKVVHPAIVRDAIAETALQLGDNSAADETAPRTDHSPLSIGEITLREYQRDACVRLTNAVREFGGALLADAVGLGKTYVALAFARAFKSVHILAPATLLPMWRDAIAKTDTHNAQVHSLHGLSRAPLATGDGHTGSLVIIDEAHHLRTRNTVRYRNAAAFSTNRSVLLLTATPLHNRPRELRNLLALFLGHRADALDDETLARCIVRRRSSAAGEGAVPTVRQHPPSVMPDNPMVLECLLTLPPPLPVQDGAAASALVRLGLLRAWCSSDAALTESIRRRQLRGEALLHSLAHGRYPTQRELHGWIVGNDSVQLGFPELLVATTSGNAAELLKTLLAHLDGLQSLLQLHTRTAMADARRAELLRSLVGTEVLTHPVRVSGAEAESNQRAEPPPAAIVAFSQFASTVRALHRALSDMAGVASLTSNGGRIASGAISRHELIANFAPKANGRPPPPPHQQIRLLLTTDLLAEGVNLQDAGVVVHLDLPWTHALRQQRVGRIVRLGSTHSVVDVYTIEPPTGADRTLQLVATLERKAGLHQRYVGTEHSDARALPHNSASIAEKATQLHELWKKWRRESRPFVGAGVRAGLRANTRVGARAGQRPAASAAAEAHDSQQTFVAIVPAQLPGWIAAVEVAGKRFVVAGTSMCCNCGVENPEPPSSASRVGLDVATLLEVARAADTPNFASEKAGCAAYESDCTIRQSIHAVHLWINTQLLRELTGNDARAVSPAQKRALQLLSSRFAAMPAMSRDAIAPRIARLESHILETRGAGAERLLEQWTTAAHNLSTERWIAAFPDDPLNGNARGHVPPHPPLAPPGTPVAPQLNSRVIALLVLQPPSDNHPSRH